MATIVLLVRMGLSAMFFTAGAAKLFDLQGSRDNVEAFGVSAASARIAGTVIPFAELVTASALLAQESARWAAIAAVCLLVVFIAGISVALANGRTPNCNCFGQVSSEQISSRTVARNIALLVLAAFAAWKAPGAALGAWTSDAAAANIVAALAVLCLSLALVAALQQRTAAAALREQLAAMVSTAAPRSGIGPGDRAPDFELPSLGGDTVTLPDLLMSERPLVLVFASPICGPCRALIPELVRWNSSLHESVTLAVVESTVPSVDGLTHDMPGPAELLTIYESGIVMASSYGVKQTPTAIAINSKGTLMAGPAVGAGAIEQLVRTALQVELTSLNEAA